MPQRPLWARVPWQRPAGAPEKDRFREGLTRGDSTEALVAGVAVAEEDVMTQLFGSGPLQVRAATRPWLWARVTGVVVAESRFKGGLPRDPATEIPVMGMTVSG